MSFGKAFKMDCIDLGLNIRPKDTILFYFRYSHTRFLNQIDKY